MRKEKKIIILIVSICLLSMTSACIGVGGANKTAKIKNKINPELYTESGAAIKLLVNNSKLISDDLLSEAADTVKIKKEDALYFLSQKDDQIVDYNYKIEKKDYSTTVDGQKVEIRYIIYQEDIWGPEAAELSSLEMIEKTKLGVYWALGKTSMNFYEIKGLLAYGPTSNDQVFAYLTPNKPLFLSLKTEIGEKSLTEIIESIPDMEDKAQKERLAYFKYQFNKVAKDLKKDLNAYQKNMN